MKFFRFSFLQYIAVFLSILASFFLAKKMNEIDYGYYSLGLIMFNTIVSLKDFGYEKNGLVRLNSSTDLSKEATLQFLIRGIVLFILLILSVVYINIEIKQYKFLFFVFGGVLVSIVPKYFFDYEKFFIKESFYAIYDRVFFLVSILVIYYFYKLDFFDVAILFFISRIIYSINTFSYLKKWINVKFLFVKKRILKQTFKKNIFLWLSSVFSIALLNINQMILSSKSGVIELGVFFFAMQFISLLRILQNQFLRWNTPAISSRISQRNVNMNYINKILLKSFLFSLFLSFLLFFVAEFIIIHFYSNYIESVKVLIILCIWSIFYGPGLVNNYILSNKIRPFFLFLITVVFTSISLVLNFFIELSYLTTAYIIVLPHTMSMFVQYILTYRIYARIKE